VAVPAFVLEKKKEKTTPLTTTTSVLKQYHILMTDLLPTPTPTLPPPKSQEKKKPHPYPTVNNCKRAVPMLYNQIINPGFNTRNHTMCFTIHENKI
jgi:hypothetical protein